MLNESLLRITTIPDIYTKVVRETEESKALLTRAQEYLDLIPFQTVARCPFCNAQYQEKVDLYSLRECNVHWASGDGIFSQSAVREKCRHWLIVQPFLNLNGVRPEKSPTELRGIRYERTSEKPHVIGLALEDKWKCKAVIHSLPICKIINGKFVPTYTLYTITYFADFWKKGKLEVEIRRHGEEWTNQPLAAPETPEEKESWWDLNRWVKAEKLYWLEPDNPEYVLKTGDVSEFPYGNIEGRCEPYWDDFPFTKAERKDGTYDRWKAEQEAAAQNP